MSKITLQVERDEASGWYVASWDAPGGQGCITTQGRDLQDLEINKTVFSCRVVFKRRLLCAGKRRQGLEDRTMQQDDGFGFWIWGLTEVIDVTVWSQTSDDG